MVSFHAREVAERLDYSSLIDALEEGFRGDINIPSRHHHVLPAVGKRDATMLLMPAWNSNFVGLKTVVVEPENTKRGLPAVQANYQLMDRETGKLLAYIDGAELTARRTASASALASRYLSRPDARCLAMVGTGVLAPHLIRAHATQRTIDEVVIWGRDIDKAQQVVEKMMGSAYTVRAEAVLEKAVGSADIISCATLTTVPLIAGNWITPGQHLDLVGAFTPEMREVDDKVISVAEVYIDTEDVKHSVGEIKDPLECGIIGEEHILGTLADLAAGRVDRPRSSSSAVTLFKSAGTALEDLIAASLVYSRA
ncbi:MAG: ornithine cyclodeaminase [Magnetovibrio sp.]|nr:ornithine cyclodeaminase [Magnetovibrio sp.]